MLLQLSAKVGINLDNVCSWSWGIGQFAGKLLLSYGSGAEYDEVLDTDEATRFLRYVETLQAGHEHYQNCRAAIAKLREVQSETG